MTRAMKSIVLAALLGASPLAAQSTAGTSGPGASGADASTNSLSVAINARRTLSFAKAIGRIEVDRDNVVSVRAPSARSLTITGIGLGDASLSVYAGDGTLLGQRQLHVLPSADADSRVTNVESLQDRADRIGGGGNPTPGAGIGVWGEQVVAVDVQFAAVSTTTLKALGFSFSKLSGDIQGAVVSPATLGSFGFPNGTTTADKSSGNLTTTFTAPLQNAFNLFLSAPNRGIGAVLSALASNGLSQLLAQPTLLVRSGEQASFLAGGEVPIPVPQSNSGGQSSIGIEFKEFGVRLKVTPYVLSKDRIVLKLAPEVSELDYTNGVRLQGYVVPGLRRRSAETTVQLGSGQSFVIAGLTYSNDTITKEKVPFVGDLPVIGAFFKRQQNQRERQELIIVATPRLVGPMDPSQVPPLPGSATANFDPSIGDMILGSDGLEQKSRPFGIVRR